MGAMPDAVAGDKACGRRDRAGPLPGHHRRLQRLPHAGLSGEGRRGPREPVAHRRGGRLPGAVGHDLSGQPAAGHEPPDRGAVGRARAQGTPAADAVVQPARDDGRGPEGDVRLHSQPRRTGQGGARVRRSRAARSTRRTSCSCRRWISSTPPRAERASARDFDQHDGPQDVEPEASAARLLDAQPRAALLEAALQQDQPGLEVLAQVRQADRRVESQLAVGVLGAAFLDVAPAAIATGSHRPRP